MKVKQYSYWSPSGCVSRRCFLSARLSLKWCQLTWTLCIAAGWHLNNFERRLLQHLGSIGERLTSSQRSRPPSLFYRELRKARNHPPVMKNVLLVVLADLHGLRGENSFSCSLSFFLKKRVFASVWQPQINLLLSDIKALLQCWTHFEDLFLLLYFSFSAQNAVCIYVYICLRGYILPLLTVSRRM